ncbi:MAG TPA: sigma-70 family RNA polymerase sigma factor [Thermoleophilaceae bacterium]|nr:sigma-70 family RNA polymerase sigma factor [Thermoleophilaceae bacterium]
MASAVATGDVPDSVLAAEEERLARAAAAGDGNAFATLYERYERRAYNLAYRVTGSEDDAADAVQEAFLRVLRRLPKLEGRELAFGSYLFTATRNASYDLIGKRKRAEPSDAIPETAAPIGAAAGGGFGLDPSGPDEDPDRKLLIESQQEEIRAANERLPERQREALALRELEELSYDEIAEIMDMNRNSVAQLISRARIKLRDELRGGALASIAISSPACERALPLIAMRDDGQLDGDGDDAAWLDSHLSDCHTCRLGMEAMQEAGASYRAWAPVVAAPWLLEETLAKAAELTGSDWSETIAERAGRHDPAAVQPGMPSIYRALAAPAAEARKRRRRVFAAAGLGAAALLAVVATVLGQDDPQPLPAAPAGKAVETVAEPAPTDRPTKKPAKRPARKRAGSPPAREPAGAPGSPPASNTVGAPAGSTSGPDAPVASPIQRDRRGARIRGADPRPRAPIVEPAPPRTPPAPPPVADPAPDPPPVEEPPVVDDPPVEPPPGRDPPPPTEPPPGSGPPIL